MLAPITSRHSEANEHHLRLLLILLDRGQCPVSHRHRLVLLGERSTPAGRILRVQLFLAIRVDVDQPGIRSRTAVPEFTTWKS